MASLFDSHDASEFAGDFNESKLHGRAFVVFYKGNFTFTKLDIEFNFLNSGPSGSSLLDIRGRHDIETPMNTVGMQTHTECPFPGTFDRYFYGTGAGTNTVWNFNTTAFPGQGQFSWQARSINSTTNSLYARLKDFGYQQSPSISAVNAVQRNLKIRLGYRTKNGLAIQADVTVPTWYYCTANIVGKVSLNHP